MVAAVPPVSFRMISTVYPMPREVRAVETVSMFPVMNARTTGDGPGALLPPPPEEPPPPHEADIATPIASTHAFACMPLLSREAPMAGLG